MSLELLSDRIKHLRDEFWGNLGHHPVIIQSWYSNDLALTGESVSTISMKLYQRRFWERDSIY
jgi:hypothetical protein